MGGGSVSLKTQFPELPIIFPFLTITAPKGPPFFPSTAFSDKSIAICINLFWSVVGILFLFIFWIWYFQMLTLYLKKMFSENIMFFLCIFKINQRATPSSVARFQALKVLIKK